MNQKKKKKKSEYTIFHFFGTLILCGVLLFIFTIGANLLSDYIIHARESPITTQPTIVIPTTSVDTEPIILGTIYKLTRANVFITLSDDLTAEIGSGTIIDEDEIFYYAITNNHVIDRFLDNGVTKTVRTSDDVTTDFEIMKSDAGLDLALIRFVKESREEIIPLFLSDLIGINTWSQNGEFYAIPAEIIKGFLETQA